MKLGLTRPVKSNLWTSKTSNHPYYDICGIFLCFKWTEIWGREPGLQEGQTEFQSFYLHEHLLHLLADMTVKALVMTSARIHAPEKGGNKDEPTWCPHSGKVPGEKRVYSEQESQSAWAAWL